jgi:Tol biopolymer transport system component
MVFDSREKGNGNIYVMNSNGGTPRQLTSGKFENNVPSWSKDGRSIYFSSNRTGTFQVWKMPAEGGEETQVTTKGGFVAFESFDGKYLYYAQKNINSEILRLPLTGGAEESVDKDLSGLLWCMWKLTDKGIYFIKPDTTQKGHVYLYNFSTRHTNQIAITEKVIYAYSGVDVSPDGRSLLYTQVDQIESDIMLIQHFH